MTWQTGADLSLDALKAQLEKLIERAEWTAEFLGWLTNQPEASRSHELELDELNGQIDELSGEIGRLERDAHEERASKNLLSIARHENLSEM